MTIQSVSTEQVQEVLATMLSECMLSAFTHRQYLDDFHRLDFALKTLQRLGLISSQDHKIFMYGFTYMYINAGDLT